MRRRPGPLGYEFRKLLLDVEAAIDQLHQDAGHFADWARELTRMNVAGQNAHAQQVWEQTQQVLDDYLCGLGHMQALFQLDRGAMFQIYNSMRRLKESGLTQRMHERRFVETEPDGLDPEFRLELREEEAAGGRGALSHHAGSAVSSGSRRGEVEGRSAPALTHPGFP